MATISIQTPTNGEFLNLTFTASGQYDTSAALADSKAPNHVTSTVKVGDSVLNTKTYDIPSGSTSGTWSVEHTVSGGPYAGCVLTAKLYVLGSVVASDSVNNLTIGDKT